MNGRPSIDQLSQAVAEFKRLSATAVDAAASAYDAYHAKVATHLQDIVQRELALGPAAAGAELMRLRSLMNDTQADLPTLQRQLCEAIATGAMDLSTSGLAEHLWHTALDQAAIDQPSYSTYTRHVPAMPTNQNPTRD